VQDRDEKKASGTEPAIRSDKTTMVSAHTPVMAIKSALGGFMFAVCVNDATNRGRVTPATFTEHIRLNEGGYGVDIRKRFTAEELQIYANNNVVMAIGTAAIATDTALDATFGAKTPSDTSPLGSARAIIYQIRCAFAHDPLNPRWNVASQYNQSYIVTVPIPGEAGGTSLRAITFNTASLAGKHLSSTDFGGLAGYLGLIQLCLSQVESHPNGNRPYVPPVVP
jgi:hypothetical protein